MDTSENIYCATLKIYKALLNETKIAKGEGSYLVYTYT